MLGWALTFLVIALVAALFGFTGLAVASPGVSAGAAQVVFVVFLVLFVAAMVARTLRGRGPSGDSQR